MRMPIAAAVAASLIAFSAMTHPVSAEPTRDAAVSQIQIAEEVSSAKRKKRVMGHPAYRGGQIACTYSGCQAIPRGCRIETGRIPFTWEPSGYDAVVCPYYR